MLQPCIPKITIAVDDDNSHRGVSSNMAGNQDAGNGKFAGKVTNLLRKPR